MKIIAYYLPQFHETPENNLWWGEGYTEWSNARKARPLFKNQYQPREPLNNRYYDLLDVDTIKWQCDLAQKYGIYGFCFYHYWFGDGRKLLEKPVENMIKRNDINMPFCFSWANEAWTRTWEGPGGEKHVLMSQKYCGKADWKEHFMYLLPFFQDKRYIRKDNKPILLIYRIDKIPCAREMFAYWNTLAKESGMEGIYLIQMLSNEKYKRKIADAYTTYVPAWFFEHRDDVVKKMKYEIVEKLPQFIMPRFLAKVLLDVFNYDKCYRQLINKKYEKNEFMGAFPDFDNTARRGNKAAIWEGSSPKKFEKYLKEIINMSKKNNKEFIFITAWNEWGEGNYLEPDKKNGYAYLHSIRNAQKE